MWKARAVQWQNAGANILTVAPKEGIITYVSGFAIPKNAPNKDGLLRVPRRGDGGVGPGGLRGRHGLQPRGRATRRSRPISRSASASGPEEEKLFVNPDLAFLAKRMAELKDFWDKEFKGLRAEHRVETAVSATADSLGSLAAREQRGGRLSTAAILVGPATIFVTVGLLLPILHPVPLQPQRLRARQADGRGADARELRPVRHRPVLPRRLHSHAPRGGDRHRALPACSRFRSPTSWRARRAGSRTSWSCCVVLPLFVGNAVRAAGWMTLFGNRGFLNVTLQWIGITTRADPLHVHRVRRHRRHPGRQPALRGADAPERDRGHRPRGRGRGLQPRRGAVHDGAARAACRSPCPASPRGRSSASSSP